MAEPSKPEAANLPVTDAIFQPYAEAIGQVALAWNQLHIDLGDLFAMVMGGGIINRYQAIWHCMRVDHAQRDILRSAALNIGQDTHPAKSATLIKWLCDETDKLGDLRNDILHAPFGTRPAWLGGYEFAPLTQTGHVRAAKFIGKEAIALMHWHRDRSMALSEFARLLWKCEGGDIPLPKTPKLPDRPNPSAGPQPRPERKAKR